MTWRTARRHASTSSMNGLITDDADLDSDVALAVLGRPRGRGGGIRCAENAAVIASATSSERNARAMALRITPARKTGVVQREKRTTHFQAVQRMGTRNTRDLPAMSPPLQELLRSCLPTSSSSCCWRASVSEASRSSSSPSYSSST